jgi:hypothetical protein
MRIRLACLFRIEGKLICMECDVGQKKCWSCIGILTELKSNCITSVVYRRSLEKGFETLHTRRPGGLHIEE